MWVGMPYLVKRREREKREMLIVTCRVKHLSGARTPGWRWLPDCRHSEPSTRRQEARCRVTFS